MVDINLSKISPCPQVVQNLLGKIRYICRSSRTEVRGAVEESRIALRVQGGNKPSLGDVREQLCNIV